MRYLASALGPVLLAALVTLGLGAGPPPPAAAPDIDSLRIDEEARRFHVRIGYPVVRGGPAGVNEALREAVRDFALSFRPTEPVPASAPEREGTWVQGAAEVGLVRPELFSAIIGVYAYTGGAHGTTVFRGVNFNPATGAPVALTDVLRDGPAFRDSLGAHVTRAVVRRLVTAFGEAPAEARESVAGYNRGRIRFRRTPAFAFVPDSLVLYIPPYDVMPYAVGPFRVPIALADLEPFLQPGGPAQAVRRRARR